MTAFAAWSAGQPARARHAQVPIVQSFILGERHPLLLHMRPVNGLARGSWLLRGTGMHTSRSVVRCGAPCSRACWRAASGWLMSRGGMRLRSLVKTPLAYSKLFLYSASHTP